MVLNDAFFFSKIKSKNLNYSTYELEGSSKARILSELCVLKQPPLSPFSKGELRHPSGFLIPPYQGGRGGVLRGNLIYCYLLSVNCFLNSSIAFVSIGSTPYSKASQKLVQSAKRIPEKIFSKKVWPDKLIISVGRPV